MAVEDVFNADTAWFSEFDQAPSKILAHHWPDVPNYGDMTKIDWANIEPVDIISGGTPCQDLSNAGRRRGMTEGTRSNLWVQMREAIAIQRPKYVVWENVRGAYSAKATSDLEHCPRCMGETGQRGPGLRALGRVLGDLSDLGFDAEWRGIRASEVGACHQRYRVFVLARRRAAATHSSGTGLAISGPGILTPRKDPSAAALGNQTSIADAYRLGYERGWEARDRGLGLEDINKPPANANGRNRDGWFENEEWEAVKRAAAARDIGVDWGEYEAGIRRQERVFGRPAPRPTEPTGRNGGERLSPRFTEWMMGLPDGWVTDPEIGITRNEQIKACGNGVVPQQAKAALSDMLKAFA
jgi:DNA (cytosine-5)-methyltransferase 1